MSRSNVTTIMCQLLAAGLLGTWMAFGATALAQEPKAVSEFRVETDVFLDGRPQPISENLTLFSGQKVYDFALGGNPETTVYDLARGQIVLLNAARKCKTVIQEDALLQQIAHLQTQAASASARLKFLAHPAFTTNFDSPAQRLTLSSDVISYAAVGQKPPAADCAARYAEFADWSARLNLSRPGGTLPFARIELNRQLASHGLAPKEIELTLCGEKSGEARKVVLRSKHLFSFRLLEDDAKKMSQAQSQVADFTPEKPDDFFHGRRLADSRPPK